MNVFLIAGEESGDQLGFGLMQALKAQIPEVRFRGVGGRAMQGQGLESLFPMSDISLMGFNAVVKALPRVLARMREAVEAILADPPDALVLIDAPDFNLRVARRVRRANPTIPIITYVCPTVWAWRPGRAARMKPYVDHVLALLPFEPQVMLRFGGPPTTYVGHPISERLGLLAPAPADVVRRGQKPPVVVVLPGSRRSEIRHLMVPFGAALSLVRERYGPLDVVLPAVAHVVAEIRAAVEKWPFQPRIVMGEDAKFAAFRQARAALAASGTVTLELAAAQVPSVVAYRVGWLESQILRRLIAAPHVALSNLVMGERIMPELLQEDATPQALAGELEALLSDTQSYRRQVQALAKLPGLLSTGAQSPSVVAAGVVMGQLKATSGF